MKLVGAGGQFRQDPLYAADSTITAGGTPQLALARSQSRTFLLIQNISAGPLYVEIGSARATATLTSGAVTSFTITNAGFGFTSPPIVDLVGGGGMVPYLGLNQPQGLAPQHPAKVRAVLTGGAVSSFVIDDPGSGYLIAPYVWIRNADLDPYGAPIPSSTSGIFLESQGPPLIWNGTTCPTDAIAIVGATTGQQYTIRWMD